MQEIVESAPVSKRRGNPYRNADGKFCKRSEAVFIVDSNGSLKPFSDKPESRASKVSTVERRIIKDSDKCPLCTANNDPRKVPVHPHCHCDVITDSVEMGTANPESRLLQVLTESDIEIEVMAGELEAPGIQLEPGSVSVMDIENVRFADFARWLEQAQPYLDAGSQYVAIVTDEDADEALADIEETIIAISEGSTELAEALQNKKLWFSIAKAVVV